MNILKKNFLHKKIPIYLDYSSTTPIDPRVTKKMIPFLSNNFGNASSRNHIYGWNIKKIIEDSRKKVAHLINANEREIIWTSGATESNNLAIKGAAEFYKFKGKHLITIKTEHKSVLDTFRFLECSGFEVTYINPNKNGLINIDQIISNIRFDTILISIMLVNNEIGVIQPIENIGKICRNRGIIFHCDAAQAIGKVKIDVSKMKIDLMSLSAHKVYGPKGIGALYISQNPKIRIKPQIHGGGQEYGLRSGTLATHQIVGMGEAFKIAYLEMNKELIRIKYMYNKLIFELLSIEETYINGDIKFRIPHNINISFNYIEGESLMMSVRDIAISSGSACTSASLEPSYVLKSLGINNELAHSSIRLSIGRFTTEKDINFAIYLIKKNVQKLRELSPLWEMYKSGINLNNIKWLY